MMWAASAIGTGERAAPGAVWRGLSGSALKGIAVAAMVLDHVGAVLLERGSLAVHPEWAQSGAWVALDLFLRIGCGRIAFPIFCFLLAEGFRRTRDRGRYARRLGLFCLLSEIPFDLAFSGVPVDWAYQNVFFTLFIGFCVLWGMEVALGQGWPDGQKRLAAAGVLLAGMALAQWLRADYGGFGVLFLALFDLLRRKPIWLRNLVCGAACAWELTAPLALIPICRYNGQRGRPLRYFFYGFYPVHLLVLALLCRLFFGV